MRAITFGTYCGAFAVLVDGAVAGFTNYDTHMVPARAAGFNSGDAPRDLCGYLGADVLARYREVYEKPRPPETPASRAAARRRHYHELKGRS